MNKLNEQEFWSLSQKEVLQLLHVNAKTGLSEGQVIQNREKYGANVLPLLKRKTVVSLLFEGLKQPMMLLLLSVALFSLFFGKYIEALAMFFVVIIYIAVELFNTARANRVMEQLKQLAASKTRVLRDGEIIDISTEEIVVGDLLILSTGVLIPVDARLISSYGLLVNEAALTGESMPIQKNAEQEVSYDAPLVERINCVFSGTVILDGEGVAVVYALGEQSQVGKIAQTVQKAKKGETFLQEAMYKLARVLAFFAISISIIIPVIGYFRGLALQEMILIWLSLTFLMIPGQPPIIITMALAISAFLLAQKKIIVKRLPGVENIAQITSIVSDKTGTITESKMVLDEFITPQKRTKKLPEEIEENIALALPDFTNDPTDKAVLERIISTKKFDQIGFDGFSENKAWREIIYRKNNKFFHAIAGRPEIILSHSNIQDDRKQELLNIVQKEAGLGKRIIAYAWQENEKQNIEKLENLNFSALAIIHDPVRAGVKKTISQLEDAKISTIICTGDHIATAKAIASEIGISTHVISGQEIKYMNDKELQSILAQSSIFARMDPLQKVRLVKILQKSGEIVAVIGDGVNDAPALKVAHVGIAMGQIGTDLAREVADLIITDDNYVHIHDAVMYGRKALDNFQKGLTYYFAAKTILLAIFIVPLIFAIPFPFTPIQIILIEVLMDLASSTIFVTEEVEPDIMKKAAPNLKNFLKISLALDVIKYSIGLSFAISCIYLKSYINYDLVTARTAAFVAWLLGHIFLALNLKQRRLPLFIQGLFANSFAIFWLTAMTILSFLITNVSQLYPFINTTALPVHVWLEIIFFIVIATFWIEANKLLIRLRSR